MRSLPEKIALVALDLDGTVVSKKLHVSDAVIRVVADAREDGIATTIVTGRMYRSAAPFAKLLGIRGPIVCYQGAGIYDAESGAVLRERPLAPGPVATLLDYAERNELHIQLYSGDDFYVAERSRFSDLYAYVSGIDPIVIPSLAEAFAHRPSTKVVIVADPADAARIATEIGALCGDSVYVTRSNPEFVEILAPGIDKGDALRFVTASLGISIDQTLAVGDSWNDIPLLRAAAFGVMMGSAPPEAKAVADAVVGDVDADGVAQAYATFIHGAVGI